MALLEVKGLKTYFFTERGVVKAVDGISFEVEKGTTLGLAGESGCGKSTTAYSIIKLVPPPGKIVEGQILLDGKTDIVKMPEPEVRRKVRWKRISMVFQGAMNALNPVYTIGKQICEVLTYHADMTKKEAMERARELMKMVGLEPDIVKRYPHELSGGMKQRVVIATALLMRPELVILDEPTSALDIMTQANIMNLLKKLKKEHGLSYLFITHDLPLASELADRLAVMYAGKLVEVGTAEQIFLDPKHPYTKGLIGSVPTLRTDKELIFIPGEVPSLIDPPPGCRFHPRCPHAMEKCKKEEPPLIEIEPEHYISCWLFA